MNFLPIVVAGPSGVGKSTLIRRAVKEFPDVFGFSISHTTREPRPGEIDGVHYHFVTEKELQDLIKVDAFLETATYNGNLYGTSKKSVLSLQEQSRIALMDIDMTGISTMQSIGFPARFVFIEPPSVAVLKQRLEGRKDTNDAAIKNRIDIAMNELEERKKYKWDFTIIGETIESTFSDFCEWLQLDTKVQSHE